MPDSSICLYRNAASQPEIWVAVKGIAREGN